MAGFTKLFSSIVTSSIWCEDNVVLRVWIAMLATCDANGVVEGSIPGFASLSRVTPDELTRVLSILGSPDPHSRTRENEGRRIESVPGGWKILNYGTYRDLGQGKEGSRAPYMRRRRMEEKRNALHRDVTGNTEAEAEEEGEEEGNASSSPSEEEASPSLSISKDGEESRLPLEEIQKVAEMINACLRKLGEGPVKELEEAQIREIHSRLQDPRWMSDLQVALTYVEGNSWFRQHPGKFTFDLITRVGKASEYASKLVTSPSEPPRKSSSTPAKQPPVQPLTESELKSRLGDQYDTYTRLLEIFPVGKLIPARDIDILLDVLKETPAAKVIKAAKIHRAKCMAGERGNSKFMKPFDRWVSAGLHLLDKDPREEKAPAHPLRGDITGGVDLSVRAADRAKADQEKARSEKSAPEVIND